MEKKYHNPDRNKNRYQIKSIKSLGDSSILRTSEFGLPTSDLKDFITIRTISSSEQKKQI